MSWTTAYETQAPEADFAASNLGGFPVRIVVAKAQLLTTGNHARFTIPGPVFLDTLSITAAWAGLGSSAGDLADFSAAPVQLTFGGDPAPVLGVGQLAVSDAVPLIVDGTKDVILSFTFAGNVGTGIGHPDCDSWAYNVGSVSDMDIGGLFNINDIFGNNMSYGLYRLEVDTFDDVTSPSPSPDSPSSPDSPPSPPTPIKPLSRIIVAMLNHLKAMSPLPFVVDDVETPYKPTKGVPYVEVRNFVSPTNTLFISGGRKQYTGILQATVVWPNKAGIFDAVEVTDEIVDRFKQGTIIDGDGVRIKITRQPSQATPTGDGAWLRCPVSITYNCMA